MAKPSSSSPPARQQIQASYAPAEGSPASQNGSGHDTSNLVESGDALFAAGHLDDARNSYRAILMRYPEHPDALHRLGSVALAAGNLDEAIGLFQRAIAGKPNDVAFRRDIATAYLQQRSTALANFHLGIALKLAPDNAPAMFLLALSRNADGQQTIARRIYEALLARHPDYMPAVIELAGLCEAYGEFQKAGALYRSAIPHKPVALMALAGLSRCEKITSDTPEAARLRTQVRDLKPGSDEWVSVQMALGRIANNSGDYDTAFQQFAAAKARPGFNYDPEKISRAHDALKEIFTPSFFAARRDFGDPSSRPVFVVGMPRSGTTLTEQIIASHPDAAGAGELSAIRMLADALDLIENGIVRPEPMLALTPETTKVLAGKYLGFLDETSKTALRVVDKLPLNFEHLGLISLLFPNAKIIHCSRDPLDTCVSCFTNPLRVSTHPYVSNLTSLGGYYREYDRLMNHWRNVLPVPIYEQRYEALTEAPEEGARKLIDFLGLPWDPACLSFYATERAVNTPSTLQVRKPIYRTSVGAWRRYEKHLGPLVAALGDLVTRDTASAVEAAARSMALHA